MAEHGHRHDIESMLSVEQALSNILDFFSVLPSETVALYKASGQVLAENYVGSYDIPPLDNSAMDGFAICAKNVRGASSSSPITLGVSGSISAGELPSMRLTNETAVRIMTGAPIPDGADAVVPFEDTDEGRRKDDDHKRNQISILTEVTTGENIRPAGNDIKCGEKVLAKGAILRSAEIGVLASMGYKNVQVIRRPKVAVLATGNELIELGQKPQPGKIYNSNSPAIMSSVTKAGGTPIDLGIAKDNMNSLETKLKMASDADMLITTAGVSKGDYDIVKDFLSMRGNIEFWSVRMRPAKPIAFGTIILRDERKMPHLGLPGNPVSAMVAFEQFGRPAICKMLGKTQWNRPKIKAVLQDAIHNTDGRRVYARVSVTKEHGQYFAKLTGDQSSNIMTSLSKANGLAICPEDQLAKEIGETVLVEMIDWSEEVF